jgi:hypothetical protein
MIRSLNANALFFDVDSGNSAQGPPQDGTFVKIRNLYGEATQGGNAHHNDATCNLRELTSHCPEGSIK